MIRLEINTEDRLGITTEILYKLYNKKIDLVSMEVFPKKVCVKIDDIDAKTKEILKEAICNIDDVISVNEIQLLSYEKNEQQLLAVINSVDEGIISIDKDFRINIFNNYCQELFNYKKEDVIGIDIRDIVGKNDAIVNLVNEGIEYDNIKASLQHNNTTSSYITTGRRITNDYDESVGAVISIKDVNKARQLVKIINTNNDGPFKNIIGDSKSIENVKKVTAAIANSDSTVLLRGDSGTGKELFANAIHDLSDRNDKRFVAINCAALPENLLESELFGYEKGSFTGAMQNGKEGLFKEANCGTIFLDEIGELSMFIQAKLLRVLQEGKIRKIGSSKEEKIDVRVIAATHKNLEQMIKDGEFREDLYYRLNVIPIKIPSLKERLEDIPILVQFFIDKLNKKLKKDIKGFKKEFIDELMCYDWPGNVRELQNLVERSMNLCNGDILTSKDIVSGSICKNEDIVYNFVEKEKIEPKSLKEEMEDYEKEIINKVYNSEKSYRESAKILGISHTAVMNKVKKYNIKEIKS
ncbi:sigma 54-interacting transcriptional regulator [Metaclostridioides mangenotii]|uniref:HTH-type transcriptional regulatory protein TyrR n=1 Tax=Metaclostridioides mangenotii TaxID=1540 RepID=A0ABS4EB08_9FIRM|nr:sigma 54-interacting transcriptional regulator [Clostridioides mangenotii]MBP1855130.1 transcriptional regulator of aroF, aroG, tyrA and aromatic amino acid transport [Clostridioides mangenotii]